MRDRDQPLVPGEIGEPQLRQSALLRAEHLAAAAQPQILLGDAEPVLGLAQDRQPPPRDVAERRLVQQQTGRGLVAAPDAAAQLVQLREAEALGVLDDHHRGRRHVDPDLDDRRRDQQIDPPLSFGSVAAKAAIARSLSALFMRPCTSPTRPGNNSLSAR